MAQSKVSEQIITLGKLIVKELKLEPGVDTLSRWMAHYIAEQISLAEGLAQGKKRKEAEQQCFATILEVWKHRWTLQHHKRPLEQFEPILKTIQQLAPENEATYYFDIPERELSSMEKKNPALKELVNYTRAAQQVDKTARTLIHYMLQQAATKARSKATQELLENAIHLPQNHDVAMIRFLLDEEADLEPEDLKEETIQRKFLIQKLQDRIEDLEQFNKLSKSLLKSYREDLKKLDGS